MAEKPSGYKNPPVLSETKSYEQWSKELNIWRMITDVDKKKQALVVTLSLSGKARETALEINSSELNADDGMDVLIKQLDAVFKKEAIDEAYEAYSLFESYKRKPEETVSDYIIEFEHRYSKAKKFEMALPDSVLAYKLLEGAWLSQKERQLVLTAVNKLEFSAIKSALKRIYGQQGSIESATNLSLKVNIEEEPTYLAQTEVKSQSNFQGMSPSNKLNRNWPPRKAASSQGGAIMKGTNPLNRNGTVSRCAICDSTCHWAKSCPHKSESLNIASAAEQLDKVNITLFVEMDTVEVFLVEAMGTAVIDTACTCTVCGERWLDNYLKTLDELSLKKVKRNPSSIGFRFGDGGRINSFETAAIPAEIAGVKCQIITKVIKKDIPLLLSFIKKGRCLPGS